jgi:hypothetical protein
LSISLAIIAKMEALLKKFDLEMHWFFFSVL